MWLVEAVVALLIGIGAAGLKARRVKLPLLSGPGRKFIAGFAPAMLAAAERTRDRWRAHPPGAEIELEREMMRTTFDIIFNTLFSEPYSVD